MIDDFKQKTETKPVRLDDDRSQDTTLIQPSTGLSAVGLETKNDSSDADELILPAVVATGSVPVSSVTDDHVSEGTTSLPEPTKTIRLFGRWTVSRKKLLIVVVILVLLIAGGTTFALTRNQPAPKPAAAAVAKPKPAIKVAPAPIVSPLTGLTVIAAKQKLPVIGVMIENSSAARPQSGLKDAGVVYEAIAEAGITRFLALYQEQDSANIGPVRSSRPYYLQWADAFDASYAHVGGSPDALQAIKALGIKDLDQFYNPVAYHRITTRDAPHNVYTSIPQLRDLATSKGYDKSTFTPFIRKSENPYKTVAASTSKTANTTTSSDSRTGASTIDFAISGAYYSVHYDYLAATNSYNRSEGGAPHMDFDSNTQLSPKVVVSLVMPYSIMPDGYHSMYNTQGTGKMYVFQDGTVQTGSWTKGDATSQFVFKDDSGKTLALNPGQTWISVVGDATNVAYK